MPPLTDLPFAAALSAACSQDFATAEEERFESRNLDDSDAHSEATGTTEEDLRPVKVHLLWQLSCSLCIMGRLHTVARGMRLDFTGVNELYTRAGVVSCASFNSCIGVCIAVGWLLGCESMSRVQKLGQRFSRVSVLSSRDIQDGFLCASCQRVHTSCQRVHTVSRHRHRFEARTPLHESTPAATACLCFHNSVSWCADPQQPCACLYHTPTC